MLFLLARSLLERGSMPSPDTYRSPARLRRSVAALAMLVTIGIAFVALIVFLGGTRALVTALLPGLSTAAITALLVGMGTLAFTLVAAVLFMRRPRRRKPREDLGPLANSF
jgi:drug/metabolite transporter (DMT)-like permease